MNKIIEFLEIAQKLKAEERIIQLPNGRRETVGSHCWMMSLMAMLLAPHLKNPINLERVLKIITVHDLAESMVHDTPLHSTCNDCDAKAAKDIMENTAMEKLRDILGDDFGDEIVELFHEYNAAETYDAKFAKAIDKLDADFQVSCHDVEYIKQWGDVYWKMYVQMFKKKYYEHEPILMELGNAIRERILNRMIDAGLNPDDYK